MKQLYKYFEMEVEVPRIRIGKRQTIETLINEEALLLAKFLRNERKNWTPRIGFYNVRVGLLGLNGSYYKRHKY